jgi:hypothetical protein
MYTGGHKKPENKKAERVDRRTAEERTGKRQVVVVAREVMGRTLPFVVPRESAAVPVHGSDRRPRDPSKWRLMSDSAAHLGGRLLAPLSNLRSHGRRLEHIEDQAGGDRRQPFPVKAERNQAALYHLHRIKRQGDRELFCVRIGFGGHGRANGIAMEFHCFI